uniref:Uncharacterized protein n=1 Tax=Panagrellus redivivus TaxID=6233 RepID=A0A7E4ZV40_PANRE
MDGSLVFGCPGRCVVFVVVGGGDVEKIKSHNESTVSLFFLNVTIENARKDRNHPKRWPGPAAALSVERDRSFIHSCRYTLLYIAMIQDKRPRTNQVTWTKPVLHEPTNRSKKD